jgi:outer membrane protein TolC
MLFHGQLMTERSLIPALALAAALLVPSVARADRPLTLDEALALARTGSKDLKAARARVEQSRAGIETARVALLPQVAAQGKYTHNYKEVTLDLAAENQALFGLADVIKATSGNAVQNGAINAFKQAVAENTPSSIVIQKAEQLDFSLSATVPLIVPSAYPALTAAKRTLKASEATFDATEAGLLFSTGQAFFAAAGADELVGARRHAIEVAQLTLTNAETRFQAGVVNRVEVTRAQLALVRAQQAAREALDVEAMAYRSLATILQLREPFHVVPGQLDRSAADAADPLAAPPDQLVEHALAKRPELIAAERSLQASNAQVSSARWRWAPSLSAFGSLRAFNYAGFSGDNYSWALGAQLDWTLYDGGARDASRHLAEAQREENAHKLSQLRDTVSDEIYNDRRALETRRAALGTAQESVALSRDTLELVRVQHEAGTATQLDLLTAQDNLVTAEVAVAQARFDLALADLQLRRAAARFPTRL